MAYDENKFKEFNRLCRECAERHVDVVLIHHPEVLGDTYEELVENMNRASDFGLKLLIVPRKDR